MGEYVFLGLFVAAFVLIFGNLVELVAMPAVAAVLIVVGIEIIDTEEVGDVWDISVSKTGDHGDDFHRHINLACSAGCSLLASFFHSSIMHIQLFTERPPT